MMEKEFVISELSCKLFIHKENVQNTIIGCRPILSVSLFVSQYYNDLEFLELSRPNNFVAGIYNYIHFYPGTCLEFVFTQDLTF